MNYGRFFALNISASRIDQGVASFDYIDLPAYIGAEKAISPRYPISVVITGRVVKFIFHYCVYQGADLKFSYQLDRRAGAAGHLKIVHMEQVLIELPLCADDASGLASVIKKLYTTPFPIQLGKGTGANEPENLNYAAELLRDRYEDGEYAEGKFKALRDADKKDDSYSSLIVWGLKDSLGRYNLRRRPKRGEIEDKSTNDSGREHPRYDKFLRKLLLDFMFDLMHTDVFMNSGAYDHMRNCLMGDFFFSAIVRKSEFYYQRALVNDRLTRDNYWWEYIKLEGPPVEVAGNTNSVSRGSSGTNKPNEPKADPGRLYSHYFDRAERNWMECIQSPLADRHFEFTPNWHEAQAEKAEEQNEHEVQAESSGRLRRFLCNFLLKPCRKLWYGLRHIGRRYNVGGLLRDMWPKFSVRDSFWFVSPEEELRRIYFNLKKDTENSCLQSANFAADEGNSDAVKIHDSVCDSGYLANLVKKDNYAELNNRKHQSSVWLFRRYDFADAFRLSFFRGANTIYVAGLLLFLGFILFCLPSFQIDPKVASLCIAVGGVIALAFVVFFFVKGERLQKNIENIDDLHWKNLYFCWGRRLLWGLIVAAVIIGLLWWWPPVWVSLIGLAIIGLLVTLGRSGGIITRHVHFAFPRLVASITAAWFTIALSEDLYKAFFDSRWTWVPYVIISLIVFVFVFVLHEINKKLPYLDFRKKLGRTCELMLISFALSVSVGIVVINFTGEKFLERGGYLQEFFRDYVLSDRNRDGVKLDVDRLDPDEMIDSYLVQLDPTRKLSGEEIVAALAAFVAVSPDAEYLERREALKRHIDELCCYKESVNYPKKVQNMKGLPVQNGAAHDLTRTDSLRRHLDRIICQHAYIHPVYVRDSARRAVMKQYLLREENSMILREVLRNIHVTELGKRSIAIVWKFGPAGNRYEFFLLYDFLILFSFVAMFIGIFIQMIFEERNITEP